MGIVTWLRPGLGVALLAFSAAAMAQNAMTTEPADLYAGPDDSYPVVAQLDPNSPIQVFGCLDDWSWCDVGTEDLRGWMYAPDITYAYQGGYVPLYSYAPSLGIAIVPFSLDVYWGRYYHGRPWYSQREEWARREIHHRRPSGPPPHAGPPPRPEHREFPHEAGRPDNRNMYNRPEPSPAPRPGEAPAHAEGRIAAPPPGHEPPPRAQPREQPHEQPHEQPREQPHGAPREAPHDEHGRPPGRAASPSHEEQPHDDHPH
jgi:uncharacterized protein YraI